MCSFSAMKMPFYYPAPHRHYGLCPGCGDRLCLPCRESRHDFAGRCHGCIYMADIIVLGDSPYPLSASIGPMDQLEPARRHWRSTPLLPRQWLPWGCSDTISKAIALRRAELPWRQLVPLAAACVGFYLAAATRRLLDRDVLRRLLWPFPETSALSVILCLTLVIAVKVTVWLWLVPSSPGISVRHFIKTTSLLALVKPGIFFVAHVVYFGPIVWEAVWLWSKVAQNVRSLGLGAVLAAALAILMSITSESRHLIPFIPLLVAATAWAMDSEPLCRADLGFCGLGPRSRQVLAADRRGYIQSRGQRLPRTAIFHESRSVDVRSFLSGPGHCGYLGGHGSEIVAGWKAQFQRNRVVG